MNGECIIFLVLSMSSLKGDNNGYLLSFVQLSLAAMVIMRVPPPNLLKLFHSRSKVPNNLGKVGWQLADSRVVNLVQPFFMWYLSET